MPNPVLLRSILASVVLALLLSYPLCLHPWTEAIGSVDGDGAKHLWNLWWMRAEILQGPWGLETTLVNYPNGMRLYPIEPFNGLLALLIPLPPVPLSNLLALIHLSLMGIFTGALGRRICEYVRGDYILLDPERGGLIAGALAQGSAFSAFTLHVGVGELRQVWWIPLGLLCAWELREAALWGEWKRSILWSLALAASLAAAVLSCFYHGFFLATALAIWALATLRPNPQLLVGYALAASLSVAIVLPVVHTFSSSYGTDNQAPKEGFVDWMQNWRQPVETYKHAALDPYEAIVPRTGERQQSDRQMMAYTGGRYLGLSTLALACLGILAAPRRALPWVIVGLGSFVLAMGTVPWWQGEQLNWEGGRILLPLAWINRALSYTAEPLNFPARYLSVTTLALALLGSLASRWRWSIAIVPIALIDIAYNDLVPWPRASFSLPDMQGLEPGTGAVFEASFVVKAATAVQGGGEASVIAGIDPETRLRAMAAQIQLGRPIQGMPVERVDHWATDGMAWARALPLSENLANGRSTDERESLYLLRQRGFDRVLLTHDARNPPSPQLLAVLDHAMQRTSTAPYGTLWQIPEVNASPEEAAAWMAAQETRTARLSPAHLAPQYQ